MRNPSFLIFPFSIGFLFFAGCHSQPIQPYSLNRPSVGSAGGLDYSFPAQSGSAGLLGSDKGSVSALAADGGVSKSPDPGVRDVPQPTAQHVESVSSAPTAKDYSSQWYVSDAVSDVPPDSQGRLDPAKERILYWGPAREGSLLRDRAREYLRIKDPVYNERALDPVPLPLFNRVPVSQNAVSAGNTGMLLSPIPYDFLLSGSASSRHGILKPLGIFDSSIIGRRQAAGVVSDLLLKVREGSIDGDLVYDSHLGWGFFQASDIVSTVQ